MSCYNFAMLVEIIIHVLVKKQLTFRTYCFSLQPPQGSVSVRAQKTMSHIQFQKAHSKASLLSSYGQ